MMDQIDRVRAFNRLYLRELGLLDRSYLGSGMGVTEVRLLYELAAGAGPSGAGLTVPGQTARGLTRALGLDEGYVSRVLQGFRRRGWLERTPVPGDARQHVLHLTAAGQAAVAPLQARSRDAVAARLAPLDAAARARLVAAMDDITTALAGHTATGDPAPVTLRGLAPGDAGWIISRHGALYAAEEGFDFTFEALVADILAAFLRDHDPACERGWIAERAGMRLGSIFCVRQSDAEAKLRLFFLEPDARGLGLGRRLLEECIGFARRCGYRRLVLWTHESHRAACALYRARGFTLTGSQPAHSFGVAVVEQTYMLDLAA